MKKAKLVFIVGPTAVGKTELALQCAEKLNSEIVSCDAMQVYRQVNIANCKPTVEMLNRIPHYLINTVSAEEEYDVARFVQEAEAALDALVVRELIPIVVGGSGLYMQTLLDGIFSGPGKDEELRLQLLLRAEREGEDSLYHELRTVDPQTAEKIHPHDLRRIVRALEVYRVTQKPISQLQPQRQGLWEKYDIRLFGLQRPRQELYDRINQRVDDMFALGLVEEIKKLRNLSLSQTAVRMIGIEEVSGFLEGQYDIEQAKYLLKLHTRHYAKRQLTWFRREKRINWIQLDTQSGYPEAMERITKEVTHE